MKQAKLWLTTIAALLCSLTASAHDFEVGGIYYNITSSTDMTVEVTYRGDRYDDYSNEYTGAVTIPETVMYNSNTYSVTSIGDDAFINCSHLASITLPEGVTTIGYGAFYDCSSLTSITLPEGVTSIGNHAFYWCSSLTSITLPEGVTEIGSSAFYGCSSLTSITIPEGVTTIYSNAFYGCKNLASIVLPKSIRYVSGEAFANCPELLNVYCNAESVPSTEADAFDGSYPEYATLYVPASAIENYKTTAPWSSFGKIAAIETSGIENADADAAYASPVIYDLSGRRMTHPEKGIYIINGCKVVIK